MALIKCTECGKCVSSLTKARIIKNSSIVMKNVFLFLSLIIFTSCENASVSSGRHAYKKHFDEILKDPKSLVVHSEKYTKEGEATVNWILDIGAKNSLGGYVRTKYSAKTVNSTLISINEYVPGITGGKKFVSPKISFTYKEKKVPVMINVKEYIGKEITLKNDICAADEIYKIKDFIKSIKEKNNEQFNECIDRGVSIIRKGNTIRITDTTMDGEGSYYFIIDYKSKSLKIEQSSIF